MHLLFDVYVKKFQIACGSQAIVRQVLCLFGGSEAHFHLLPVYKLLVIEEKSYYPSI